MASVRLTLWLLAVLTIGMALATLIPWGVHRFAWLEPLVAKTTLRNIYGSWWFIGAFGLLAVNLLACSIQRTGQLLRQGQLPEGPITRAQVLARGHQARWRVPRDGEEVASILVASLHRRGYQVVALPGENGHRGLAARRGRLAPWAPVIVHVGMVIVLLGAAWGRLPSHTYRTAAALQPGETFPVTIGEDAFGLRLVDAGAKRDARGQPSDFWARVELMEEGRAVRAETVRPNHPLRYHSVSMVLQSIMPAGYSVEVARGQSRGLVPVVFSEEGVVDMMSTIRRLDDPPWIVFIHDFQEAYEQNPEGPEAKVFIDQSGELSHNWQLVGWVGERGLDYAGTHFRLVRAGSGAQLSLDRDVGVPIVYLGLVVTALGSLLILGGPRRSLVALVAPRGRGSQVLVGLSRSRRGGDGERLLEQLQSELGAASEAGPPREGEETK